MLSAQLRTITAPNLSGLPSPIDNKYIMDGLSDGTRALRKIAFESGKQDNQLSTFLQRLSSGQRTVDYSDDPAGAALADKAATDSKLYTSAIRNISDGISAVNIASDALEQLSTLATRMQELAQRASTTTLSNDQRSALDEEAQLLRQEFGRVSASAEFNGQALFAGTASSLSIQAGIKSNTAYSIQFGSEVSSVDFETVVIENTYSGQLSSATTYATGAQRRGMDTADFNGDGHADIAVIGGGASVQVRLGNGDGTFGAGTNYSITPLGGTIYGSDLEVGDFDGDGISDLIGVSYGSSVAQISFLKGNGDGTFQAATSESTITSGLGFKVSKGDFDEDGDLDLVITDGFTNQTSLYTNDGTANFSFSSNITGGYGYDAVAVADFNGDGNLDFAGGTSGGTFTVIRGNGNGTFQSAVNLTAGGFVYSQAAGDIDGDGDIDIVVSNGTNNSIGVFRNNGDATFAARVDYAVSSAVRHVELGDITGDGILDILAVGTSSNYALVNSGTGTFTLTSTVASTGDFGSVAGDYNGDGVYDLATVSYGGTMGIYRSTSTLQSTTAEFSLTTVSHATAAVSMFQDIKSDLDVARGRISAGSSRLEVSLSNADAMRANLNNAVSSIRDVDVASEMAGYISARVRKEGAQALFAHALRAPQMLTGLLLD